MTGLCLPPWVVLHIPHDSVVIPDEVKSQFLVSDAELSQEIQRMTDHSTLAIFSEPRCRTVVVRSPVSRLVVDVERFPDDDEEPMAARGMGAVYKVTSQLTPLRREITMEERDTMLRTWYYPHHQQLESAVDEAVASYGRCLIIDGHSFPATPLPYEAADERHPRPEICIGSDSFHTPPALEKAFVNAFKAQGWNVALNDPFSGALVPGSRYRRDKRVSSVMVEVNRSLYLAPETAERTQTFSIFAAQVRQCCYAAISATELNQV